MTRFASTWNPGAPKVVSDGLFTYAGLVGFGTDQTFSIVRKRGTEAGWMQGGTTIHSDQPPVLLLDRKCRLNVLFNTPYLRHIRFEHPQVDLQNYTEIPVPFTGMASYIGASYDASTDTMVMAFNDSVGYALNFSAKYADNAWTSPALLPLPQGNSQLLYARPLRARGRYFVLASEHLAGSPNPNYVSTILYESGSPVGGFSRRDLYRVSGANAGEPSKNWVFHTDLAQDNQGRVRAMYHLREWDKGGPGRPSGYYIAREEAGYAPECIGSETIEGGQPFLQGWGFGLYSDPSGTMVAVGHMSPGLAAASRGHIVHYVSTDRGTTWSGPRRSSTENGLFASIVDARSGSMLGTNEVRLLFNNPVTPPYHSVVSETIPVELGRADTTTTKPDGTRRVRRQYTEPGTGRTCYWYYDTKPDGSWTLGYNYQAGSFYRVYEASSNGSYKTYDSDGYASQYVAPELKSWWSNASDGSRDWAQTYTDPANGIDWYAVTDYQVNPAIWSKTYVYRRPGYWYVELSQSTGKFVRYDSTGYYLAN